MARMTRTRSYWGWGYEDRLLDRDARAALGQQIQLLTGFAGMELRDPRPIEAARVASARVSAPDGLSALASPRDRATRAHGRCFPDILRGFTGDFTAAPDVVLSPESEEEIARALEWASERGYAVAPYGGGTSVVRGFEVERDAWPATVCLDLAKLDRVLEVDATSRAARIQGGASGPRLEAQLREHGLTLRFFPQSFELSTLGGWIATRAGGHFATGPTHIDDLVESIRTITPRGVMETRRLPASGAGPSADRLMLGSEGTLGVITEAWVRVLPRPTFRASASIRFHEWKSALSATRALAQSGLMPSNCRLLDKREALLNRVTMDGTNVLIVAFESADHEVEPRMKRALELATDHGGMCPEGARYRREGDARADSEGERWREAFVDAPYLLNTLVSLGLVVDTFETACTWDRMEALHAAIVHDVRDAMKRVAGRGMITCRVTHVYPDGLAPYFTFIAPGKRGSEIAQWTEIKQAASEAILAHGGTITHHHAVGRLHRPWYERERPALFGDVLRAAKAALDPRGILNPGVLF
jgi:alkyldihydroxyacetonephosphate synthase